MRGGFSPWGSRKPSIPSPRRGFAQKFKVESKVDRLRALNVNKLASKPTFWAKLPDAHAGGRPPVPGRSGLAPHTDPVPGAPRLRVWIQPTHGRKHHGQPAVSWSRAPHLQRPSRRDRPNGDGCHGAQRGDIGAHPRVSSVEAGAHVPPTAAVEMPESQSMQCLNKLVTTIYTHSLLVTPVYMGLMIVMLSVDERLT
jgi:hypothetical protein